MEQAQASNIMSTANIKSTGTLAPSSGFVKFLKDCTAGTVGGIAVVGVGHPFGVSVLSLE